MAKKIKKREKRNSHSFSIEDSIFDEFKIYCEENSLSMSKLIRNFIIKTLDEGKK